MKMDLDTEDRVDRVRGAMRAVQNLINGSDPHAHIAPGPFSLLFDILNDEFDRALPRGGGRPPRAVNDEDADA